MGFNHGEREACLGYYMRGKVLGILLNPAEVPFRVSDYLGINCAFPVVFQAVAYIADASAESIRMLARSSALTDYARLYYG